MTEGIGLVEGKINVLTISCRQLSPQPVKLYYRGYFDQKMQAAGVAVVGSRRMTEYGRRVVKKLVPGLVTAGKVIVSGLMYGVDQAAHRECLECGGITIAVLGWGINWNGVGKEEMQLAEEIVNRGGAVVSQWREQRSTLWTFPQRDRIMAALASDIYVVEAASRSGALITADWGTRLGKKIWSVPGPVTSKVSEGTNQLIASGQAKMWLPEQQLDLDFSSSTRARSNDDTELYILLQNEALCINEIAVKLGRSVKDLGAKLSMMQLRGEVEEKAGKYYILE